jgi:hypothetical protein
MSETIVDVNDLQIVIDTLLGDEIIVDAQIAEVIIELSGEQGPAGTPGNATIIQESTPISGMIEGDLWVNPVSNVMSIFINGVWVPETQDDGYF